MSSISLIGLVLSVGLSVGLMVLGVDKPSSVIIGLLTTSISLLVDIIARAGKMEERLVHAGGLSQDLIRDTHLFSAVSSIVNDYHRVIDTAHYDLFSHRARDALSECRDTMHNVVEGYMVVPPLSPSASG